MKLLFGVPEERVRAIADRHVATLALMHAGALGALAQDHQVSPEEMVATVKYQLVAGLASMIATEARQTGAHDLSTQVEQVHALLRGELGVA